MSNLIRRNDPFKSLIEEMFNNEVFDWRGRNFSAEGSTLPSVNVKQNDDQFTIELAAPGMKKEDFTLRIEKDSLTISAEKQSEIEDTKEQYSRREFSYQSFTRSFQIPLDVADASKIQAKYVDGILQISIPKKDSAKPQPAVEISIQ